jgi:signal recognition particle receptor subunit beta
MDANLESLENLRLNLEEQGFNLDELPYVIQYNKRDMPEVLTLEELDLALNPTKVPGFEAVAIKGPGVFETLKGLARQVIQKQRGG